MKASHFPREYRAWNLDENRMMNEKELISAGFSIAPDGLPSYRDKPFACVVMWRTGLEDSKKNALFEGDICKVDIQNEFGSLTQDYAIMRWVEESGAFILKIPASFNGIVNVVNAVRLGNEFANPELKELVAEIV